MFARPLEAESAPGAAPQSPRAPRRGGETTRALPRLVWPIAALVIIGFFLRLDFLTAGTLDPARTMIDADEAIVGLMAKHIAEGTAPIPTFYYGQHYMGSFEPMCVSLVFRLFGRSPFTLQLVPFCFSLLLIPIAYLLVREVCGRRAAFFTAALIAAPPTGFVVWSAKARGGFIEIIVLGTLAMLCTVRWLKEDRGSLLRTWAIGLILGFGWWTNNQIIYFIAPIGFTMLARVVHEPRFVRTLFSNLGAGIGGFAIGSAPFWAYNVSHDFASFGLFGRASLGEAAEHLAGVGSTALPILLGAERFWSPDPVFPGAIAFSAVLYGTVCAAYLWMRKREILRLSILSVDRREPIELFLLFAVATIAAFALSTFGYLVEAPRYLLPLYIGVYGVAGYVLARFDRAVPWLARTMLLLMVVFNLSSSYAGGRAIPGEPFVFAGQRVTRSHAELLSWLESHGYSWIKTNYWIGYRIAFETDERVRFVLFQEPRQVRIPEYEELGRMLPPWEVPYVLVPKQAEFVEVGLTILGNTFKRAEVGEYVVLYDVRPATEPLEFVPAETLKATATNNPGAAPNVLDGDVETRWGSASPQDPSMAFTVTLDPPAELRGVEMLLGRWPHDHPRELEVIVETVEGERLKVVTKDSYRAMRFVYLDEAATRVLFDPRIIKSVTLHQLGSHPIFDWSLAEIHLLRRRTAS